MLKTLVVSTVNYNPGDEFIRLGQQYLLRKLFPEISFELIHKHDPRCIFSEFDGARSGAPWHPRLVPLQYRIYAGTKGKRQSDQLENSDLVVFAGTPFVWLSNARWFPSHSGNAEWVGPIWKRLFTELPHIPVLNLAAGTSVQSEETLDRIVNHRAAGEFLTQALGRAALTTARDRNTKLVAERLGFDIPVFPCTSLWASGGANLKPQVEEYVAVNLMRHAVHKYRGTITSSSNWKDLAKHMVSALRSDHDVLLICHSKDEERVAREWFPKIDRFYSQRPEDLLSAYSKASFGITNRVHGAAGVATFGRPSLVIGGDTRVDLISEFGLPALDNRNLDIARLDRAIEGFMDRRDELASRLAELKATVEPVYLHTLRDRLLKKNVDLSGLMTERFAV